MALYSHARVGVDGGSSDHCRCADRIPGRGHKKVGINPVHYNRPRLRRGFVQGT
jgi:hypothetical protein